MIDFDAQAQVWDDNPGRLIWIRGVAAAIREAVPLSTEMRALDYGCGTGALSFLLHQDLGCITLADSSSGMVARVTEKIAASGIETMDPVQLDLLTDPLPEARYDVVYSMMALHHIPNTAAILRRLYAVTRPGGWLCLVDLDAEDGTFHGLDVDVHHGFNREALRELLARAGWTVGRITTCWEIEHQTTTGTKVYPLFLAVAQRKVEDRVAAQ